MYRTLNIKKKTILKGQKLNLRSVLTTWSMLPVETFEIPLKAHIEARTGWWL